MLDESSTVKPDDYLVSEFWERSYSLLQYKLSAVHSARHRWYYFPAMTRDEVLLFKQVSFAVCLEKHLLNILDNCNVLSTTLTRIGWAGPVSTPRCRTAGPPWTVPPGRAARWCSAQYSTAVVLQVRAIAFFPEHEPNTCPPTESSTG